MNAQTAIKADSAESMLEAIRSAMPQADLSTDWFGQLEDQISVICHCNPWRMLESLSVAGWDVQGDATNNRVDAWIGQVHVLLVAA